MDTQQATKAQTYRVTFNRIGRNHHVAPLAVEATNADTIAEAVYRYARPHLASRDVEVSVDLATGQGQIFCGFNNGGTFTVEPT
jgi:adenylyl- and sulfurtransferase ThiI